MTTDLTDEEIKDMECLKCRSEQPHLLREVPFVRAHKNTTYAKCLNCERVVKV